MKPVRFPEQNLVLAEDQPEYQPLPIHLDGSPYYTATSCWQLTWWEVAKLLFGGRKIWWQQMTFGRNLQPQLGLVDSPFKVTT
jgi:hypothetical protein